MFRKRLGISNNQTGVVFPYLLILLLLICLQVENMVREYISFQNFIVEAESKLVSEHLLFMASHDAAHFENLQPGKEGIWVYPVGEVVVVCKNSKATIIKQLNAIKLSNSVNPSSFRSDITEFLVSISRIHI